MSDEVVIEYHVKDFSDSSSSGSLVLWLSNTLCR